jgi:hypothetical protein
LLALFQPPDLHLFGNAENGFFELQRNVFAQVGAALSPRPPAWVAAKDFAKIEEIAEDVLKIGERRRIESDAAIARDSGVPEPVIPRPLLRIGKHRVCLAALLKLLFRLGIVGVTVGMVLHRQLAVGALDFLVARRAAHSQNFVVIAFYFGRQCCFPYSI